MDPSPFTGSIRRSRFAGIAAAWVALAGLSGCELMSQRERAPVPSPVSTTAPVVEAAAASTSVSSPPTVSSDEMAGLCIVSGEELTALPPPNISTYQPTLSSGGGCEPTAANLRGTDPTFGSRTLTVVEGRRVVAIDDMTLPVELNIIPSNLLERRINVVSGGATATAAGTTAPAPDAGPVDQASQFIGNTIQNLRDMDPTFGQRKLTLVDGRMVVSVSNQADVVGLNVIPPGLACQN